MRAFLRAALPVLAIVSAAFAWRAFAGTVPLLDLRYTYAFVAVGLAGMAGFAADSRAAAPKWLPAAIAVFVTIELSVSVLRLEPVPPAFNRFEHFSALFLFATLALAVARMLGVSARTAAGLLVGLGATAAGFANELLEYRYRLGTPFFSPDTCFDLATNAVATLCALAAGLRSRGAATLRE